MLPTLLVGDSFSSSSTVPYLERPLALPMAVYPLLDDWYSCIIPAMRATRNKISTRIPHTDETMIVISFKGKVFLGGEGEGGQRS